MHTAERGSYTVFQPETGIEQRLLSGFCEYVRENEDDLICYFTVDVEEYPELDADIGGTLTDENGKLLDFLPGEQALIYIHSEEL